MTAHVAEASEGSGRVLLWLDPTILATRQAIEASVRLAAAYRSELETVDVEPPHVEFAEGVPTRRVAARNSPAMSVGLDDDAARNNLAARQRRAVDEFAATFEVPVAHTSVAGDAIDRLAEMCTERGPWNVVALSRMPSLDIATVIAGIFANVSGATGVLVGSRRLSPWSGRIAVVAEDGERLPSMLRAADRIAGRKGSTHLIVAAPTQAAFDDLEAQARLLPEGGGRLNFAPSRPTLNYEGALDDALIKTAPDLTIARFGGTLLSDGAALSRTLALTGAAFLLVR
ncbi:MAG: hypothetical protein ACKVP4_00600 [Hyphomicrobium sp.]